MKKSENAPMVARRRLLGWTLQLPFTATLLGALGIKQALAATDSEISRSVLHPTGEKDPAVLTVAHVTIDPIKGAAMLQAFEHPHESPSEPGLLARNHYKDLSKPNTFIVMQQWATRADYDRHVRTAMEKSGLLDKTAEQRKHMQAAKGYSEFAYLYEVASTSLAGDKI